MDLRVKIDPSDVYQVEEHNPATEALRRELKPVPHPADVAKDFVCLTYPLGSLKSLSMVPASIQQQQRRARSRPARFSACQ
jgi:hypothetical protein